MKKLNLIACLLIGIVIFCACKKGDTGATGATGPAGERGNTGNTGPTGSANVIYSDWLSVTAGEWKDTSMPNYNSVKRIIKTASALTQPILDSGVILAYVRDGGNNIYQLPFTFNYNPARLINFIPTVGKFVFFEYGMDGNGGVTSTLNKYRYILIPGGVRTSGRVASFASLPYEKVCETLNIPQ